MDREDSEQYKKILDKYKFPYSSDEEVLEIIDNVRNLAQVILNFEQKRNGLKNYDKRRANNQKL